MKKEYFKIGLIFVVTVAAVVFALNFLYGGGASQSTKASGETFTMTFDPASMTTTTDNQDFTVTLKIKPSVDLVVRGYALTLPFDKDKLKVKTIEYKAGAATADLADTTASIATVNQNGTMKLIGESTAATGIAMTAANTTDLITLTLTSPFSTSGATLALDSNSAKLYAIKSDATLFEVPLTALVKFDINGGGTILLPTGTVSPTGAGGSNAGGNTSLNLKLKFQGIAGQPAGALNSLKVRAKIGGCGLAQPTEYKEGTFTADTAGIWSGSIAGFNLPACASGFYTVYVKGMFHIQKKVCDSKPTETAGGTYRCSESKIALKPGANDLDFSGILMLAGDLPVQDGTVNAYDTSLVRNNLGKSDADAVSKADVNRDGKVDTQDYSLIIAALSVKNDEE